MNKIITIGNTTYVLLENTGHYTEVTTNTFYNLHADLYTWYEDQHGYARAFVDGTSIGLHEYLKGKRPGLVIDHIDRDRLNNKDENLRTCTQKENSYNRSTPKNNELGLKGISLEPYNKKRGILKYRVHIWPCIEEKEKEKKKSQGRYIATTNSILAAKIIYNIVSKWYYGEYAFQHEYNRADLTEEIMKDVDKCISNYISKEEGNNRDVPRKLGSFYYKNI